MIYPIKPYRSWSDLPDYFKLPSTGKRWTRPIGSVSKATKRKVE